MPLVSRSHTHEKDDITWVDVPLRPEHKSTVCLGCCIDVYGACRSDEFSTHPYADFVQDAACVEGMEVSQFRDACLRHQLKIMKENPNAYRDPQFARIRAGIESILSENR